MPLTELIALRDSQLYRAAALVETVKVAGAPVICETGEDGRKDDIAWLRDQL